MPFRSRFGSLLRTVLRQGRLERELDEELYACVEELVARKVDSGLPAAQARREALLELGGIEQVKEEVRRGRIGQEIISTLRDVRYGARLLGRSPGFAFVAILTLALGIGANVTVFSVMHSVLWRSLPYPDADRLVVLQVDARGIADAGAAPGELRDLRARSRFLESFGAINGVDAHVSVAGGYERVAAASASDELLPLLGAAPPAMGRLLRSDEDEGEMVRSVVISDGLWRRSFGGDPAALGRQVQVNNIDVRIVGILRPGFRVFLPPDTLAAEEIDVWFPKGLPDSRQFRGLPVVGRLKPGATIDQAQAELDALTKQFVADHPSAYPGGALKLSVRPLRDALTAEVRPALLVLAGAVGFVLLIACVNVANLMVARGKGREHEFVVRRALGASRIRLVRQLLAESLLLAASGAAFGLLLGYVGVELVDWLRPSHLPRQSQIAIDRTVVFFTVALSALTPLVLGILPAMRLAADRGAPSVDAARAATAAPGTRRLQRTLVVAEVALSIIPLVAAGLLLRTFVNLTHAPLGFEPSNVVTARVPIAFRRYRETDARWALFREVLRNVRELPGVDDVSAGGPLPFGPWQVTRRYGSDTDPSAPMSLGTQQSTMPGYLKVMGTPLREGRDFTVDDFDARRPVVIVDERIARQFWPDGALGKQLVIQVGSNRVGLEVIGVTAPLRVTRVRDEGLPHFFLPYHLYSIDMSLVIKTRERAEALAPALKRAIEPLATGRAIFDVRPMTDYVAQSIGDTRFTLLVMLGFAGASLLLAGVGVYGTLAYLISQRSKEFGVRMALGATAGRLVAMVVGEGAALAAVGAAIGLGGAVATMGLLRRLLYEVTPFDAVTLILVVLIVSAVAIAAAARPAWRAARTDPSLALRGA
jgi:predicted permease